MNLTETQILEGFAGFLKSNPDLAGVQTEMLDVRNLTQSVAGWDDAKALGLHAPGGDFEVIIRRVQPAGYKSDIEHSQARGG
jgi:hypothetical protein